MTIPSFNGYINGNKISFVGFLLISTNNFSIVVDYDISPQIRSVSYSSDGKTLDVTLWLSSQLLESNLLRNEINGTNFDSEEFMPLWKDVKFVVVLDVKSAFNKGIDYRIEFSGSQNNNTDYQWQQDLYEISLDGTAKKKAIKVYNEFPNDIKYLDFDINLNNVSNPQNYNILSYVVDSYVRNGLYCRMVDSTNWIMIPPPDFDTGVSPAILQMRPNGEDDVLVSIKGNTEAGNAIAKLDTGSFEEEFAVLNFRPDTYEITSFGNNTSNLHIRIPGNLTKEEIGESKRLFIPIRMNISFPTTITNREGGTFSNNISIGLSESANLTLTVLPPLEWYDYFSLGIKNITDLVRPIGELWALVLPIGAGLVSIMFCLRKSSRRET